MAEIADAINDILENNKLDDERDTPLEGTSADVDAMKMTRIRKFIQKKHQPIILMKVLKLPLLRKLLQI